MLTCEQFLWTFPHPETVRSGTPALYWETTSFKHPVFLIPSVQFSPTINVDLPKINLHKHKNLIKIIKFKNTLLKMIKSNPKKKPCLELDDLTALKNTPKKRLV